MSKIEITDKDIEVFWSRVDKNGPIPEHLPSIGKCWVWLGTMSGRYGGFKRTYAHRVSYQIHFHDPDGFLVCHRCDNPKCCNPNHLFLGTHKDNTKDMLSKGRQGGEGAKGESNHGAVLTESEVISIRKRFSEGESRESLMIGSKVSRGSLNKILRGYTWKHI